MDKNELLWRIFQNTNDWLKFSETKAGALIGIQGVFCGFLLNMIFAKNASQLSKFSLILFFIALILNLLSVLFSFFCINPHLKLKGGVSPIYFGTIAENFNDSEQYQEYIEKELNNDKDYHTELCGQIYVNSCIARDKYRNVTYSLRFFIGSLFFWLILLVSQI